MFRRKNSYLLVLMLVIPAFTGAITPAFSSSIEYADNDRSDLGYSHSILGEFATWTTCQPCRFSHRALKNLYSGGWHPFYYMTFVYDDNTYAKTRMEDELGCSSTPTVFWDGGFAEDQGATGQDPVQECMNRYNASIISCGNRVVKDIDLVLDVDWLGATNPVPADNGSDVVVEAILEWDVTAMDVSVEIVNNEASQYNGHLHVYVSEVNSSYWDDKYGDPYTFAFLDYAFNEDTVISAGGSWSDSYEWDGVEHHNGKGEYFDEITQENCMVIASVFDEDNNDYSDETVGVRAGVGTDPKVFDIYFGNVSPPPKVEGNTTARTYDPPGNLLFDEVYFWKVDVWDSLGGKVTGEVFNFTTRVNDPPNVPSAEVPYNESFNIPIDTNLSWFGGDPDDDDVLYDVFFGIDVLDLTKVAANQSDTVFDPSPYDENLDFSTFYYWQVVAWDEYGLVTVGPIWNFRTENNVPPDPASEPFPVNGSSSVPVDVVLSWNGTDPNSGDLLMFDVYFDDSFPLVKWSSNRTSSWWEPEYTLALYQRYYWQVVTWDSGGLCTVGPIWWFETGEQFAPSAPVVSGPVVVVAGVEESYSFVASDANGDDVMFVVDWGDGVVDESVFVGEGVPVVLSHVWEDVGDFSVSAVAVDSYGNEGVEGGLDVVVPKEKGLFFYSRLFDLLFNRFPNMFLILGKLIELSISTTFFF
jgi:hypothetical protein